MYKRNGAILSGISTIALATLISGSALAQDSASRANSNGAKASRNPKASLNKAAEEDSAVAILTSSTSTSALKKTPAKRSTALGAETKGTSADAIMTSSASANSIEGGQNSLKMSVPGTSGGILSNFTARYDGVYYGPSVMHLSNADMPSDTDGNDGGGRVFIRNAVGIGYKPTSKLLVGAVAKFDYLPTHQKDYKWVDSYVRVMAPKLVDRGNFSMVGDLRLYLPTSASMRIKYGENYSVRTALNPSYNIPHSRFSVGANTFSQYYSLNERAVPGTFYNHELYFGPNLSFQATPTVALSVLYEMDAVHKNGDPLLTYVSDTHGSNTGFTDLEPGVSWDVTPNLNINPFLNMYPGSNFSLETTNINLVVGFKML